MPLRPTLGLSAAQVVVKATYTYMHKETGKSASTVDLQRWTVEGGKVKAMKFFLGNPAGLDATFAPEVSAIEVIGRAFEV